MVMLLLMVKIAYLFANHPAYFCAMAYQWMRVLADDRQWEELSGRKLPENIGLLRSGRADFENPGTSILADFILQELRPDELPYKGHAPSHPVFINAVIATLGQFPPDLPIIRMNGWPGFIGSSVWELSAGDATRSVAEGIMMALEWPHVWVADGIGLVTPRVVAMIISEARLALGEGVGTREDIDTAMKLGTNYPYGPFEWEARIGVDRIAALLDAMAAENDLYADSRLTTPNQQT
jgi:3-hydroxybutyryl-CoA dehydrogenase